VAQPSEWWSLLQPRTRWCSVAPENVETGNRVHLRRYERGTCPDRSRSSANRLPRFVYVLLAWWREGRRSPSRVASLNDLCSSRRSLLRIRSSCREMVNANKGGQLSRVLTGSTRVLRAVVFRYFLWIRDWKPAGGSNRFRLIFFNDYSFPFFVVL